ncbi:MAG TPA: hypothetical protein VJC21_04515 [Candidatus Nanoarchaeia archaeon]|nr:hypothetical protein [Candidatus Nanoarchaeia archaeon]
MGVNTRYVNAVKQIKTELQKRSAVPSIQLFDFFEEKEYWRLRKAMQHLPFRHEKKLLYFSYSAAAVPQHLLPSGLLAFLEQVLGKKPQHWMAYRFSWKDYCLLHDKSIEKPGTDLILDCTEEWPKNAGGKLIYTDAEGNGYPLAIQGNSLAIIVRKKGIQKFFQYVNHYSRGRERLLLLGTLEKG